MKHLADIDLSPIHQQALEDLRGQLARRFAPVAIILYGSVARGQADDESDIDLLVVTPHPLARLVRHQITDLVFDTNLHYGTNFSTLVVDRQSWESGLFSVLPLRQTIDAEGIAL